MKYINIESGEIVSRRDLQNRLHVSFPPDRPPSGWSKHIILEKETSDETSVTTMLPSSNVMNVGDTMILSILSLADIDEDVYVYHVGEVPTEEHLVIVSTDSTGLGELTISFDEPGEYMIVGVDGDLSGKTCYVKVN